MKSNRRQPMEASLSKHLLYKGCVMKKSVNMAKLRTNMILTRVGVSAAALMLAGCTLAPNYERPQSPVSGAWPDMRIGVPPEDQQGLIASDLSWQQFFGDERLKRLIEVALENNRDMRVAILNIERARAQYQVQRSDLLPSVGASGSINRQTTGSGGRSVLTDSAGNVIYNPLSESALNASSYNTYQAAIGITSYELDLFGRVRSLSAAALSNYLSTVETRKATQISLIASVATGYYTLLADDELLKLTEETLKTREESLQLTQLKFDHGVSSELDVRQAETLVESARSTLAQLRRQRAQDENAFMLLIGGPLPADLPQGVSFAQQMTSLPELRAGVPSDVLVRRPDILAAEQQLVAANANIGAARAAFFPSISLTASLGKASGDLDNLFSSGHVWTFMPQITLPIFTGGRNIANLEVANVDRDIAVAQYEKAIQSAFRDVSDALAGRATYDDQLTAMRALVMATQKTYQLSDLRYRNGVSSYMDLLDSQRALFDAQQQEITAQLAMLNNQITLYKVLGGGWSQQDEERMSEEMNNAGRSSSDGDQQSAQTN